MDRLSAQDAMFLYLEGPNTPYHVASLMIFEGTATFDDIVQLVDDRLDMVPIFRKRLADVPIVAGRPVWIDDEHFDIRYHVRHSALGTHATDAQLLQTCAELMEQHLDRTRPLWEMYYFDDLEGGRCAVFGKTHHSMVDGVSGVDVTTILLDASPTAPRVAPSGAPTTHAPSRPALVRDALVDRLTTGAHAARRAASLALHPRELAHDVTEFALGAGAIASAAVHPTPPCLFNVPIGPNRAFAVARESLDDFRMIKSALGGTVNDVVLAAVTGGLRALYLERGVDPGDLELKAMVPVSLRAPDQSGATGNRVSTIIAPLPLQTMTAGERYDRICRGTIEAKRSHQSAGADGLIQLSGILPPVLVSAVAHAQNVQRFFNLSITNVPGPRDTLYALGHPMLDIYPFTPLAGNMALIVAVVSYAGQMEFGFTADAASLPDVDAVARGVSREVEILKGAAGLESERRPA